MKRTIFGSLFVIVVIGSILVNFWAFFIVMTASVFLGVKEVNRLLSKDIESKSELPSLIYSMSVFVLSSVVMCADVPFNLGVFAMFSFPLIFLLIPFLIALFSKQSSFVEIAVKCWTSLLFVVLPCILLLSMYRTSPINTINGKILIIILFSLIWINDIFAYLTGMLFGRHKLFERISPKKTIEGSLGGLTFTVLAAFIINKYLYPIMSGVEMMGLSVTVVVFGSLGDLCESMLKRQAGVKDSGNLIPGHGGILDRFDATFLAVPFAYCYFMLI
ncbi:MAG: phosphatidate cytidylyltransferase [Bacteroidales bacterium]|nr:phosphatidate cytidylyltransferase [Bacteroidales bacterium]